MRKQYTRPTLDEALCIVADLADQNILNDQAAEENRLETEQRRQRASCAGVDRYAKRLRRARPAWNRLFKILAADVEQRIENNTGDPAENQKILRDLAIVQRIFSDRV